MKVIFKKLNPVSHEITIIRKDRSNETTILDTDTYQLHDICHFYVEKELKTMDGFWGMLSQGYTITQLSGKTNTQTEKLLSIECIAGATQSVYSNHMGITDFYEYIATVNWDISGHSLLEIVIPQIDAFMKKWKYLQLGESISLDFSVEK